MDSMECDVCFHQYDEEERQPRTLSCGHSLCNVCVHEGITNEQLTCPFCREVHNVMKASNVPVSFALLKVIRNLSTVGSFSSATSAEKTTSTALHPHLALQPELHAGICAEHGSYRLFWCGKCQVWVCRDCTVVEHPSGTCSVISIKQALKTIKEEEAELVKQTGKNRNIHVNSLNDYQTKLTSYSETHDEQLEAFQELIEEQQGAKCLLKKEHERVNLCLANGHETLQKMQAASKNLAEENTVEGITAARHQCQRNRKDVESWIKFSEENLALSDALKVSKKLQKEVDLMLKSSKMARDPTTIDGISSFMDFIQKTKNGTPVTIEDLYSLCRFTTVWAVLADSSRAASLSLDKGCLRLHALREAVLPTNAFTLSYENIRALVKIPPEVFMEFYWDGQKQGCVHIQTETKHPESKAFLQRCTGEDVNSFLNSKMIQVLSKNEGEDRLCGGGDGRGDKVTEPNNTNPQEQKMGWVTLATLGTATCFAIRYKLSHSHTTYRKKLGNVISGLEVVEKAAQQPDVSKVEISECGFLIN